MKVSREHIVPLAPQIVAMLAILRPFTGHFEYVFPHWTASTRPMGTVTLCKLLERLGFKDTHCMHGFRSSFSTIMNERHPEDWAAIEAALAHGISGVRGAYMRGNYLERRRELMIEWANLLLEG
jgi:integrase